MPMGGRAITFEPFAVAGLSYFSYYAVNLVLDDKEPGIQAGSTPVQVLNIFKKFST
eukprot:SAG31_NODE_2262_length_6062_cov_12.422774_2_plen_56_part_00